MAELDDPWRLIGFSRSIPANDVESFVEEDNESFVEEDDVVEEEPPLKRFKLDVDNKSFVENEDVDLDHQIQCTDLLDHIDAESNESFHPDDAMEATQSTQAMPSTSVRPSAFRAETANATGRRPCPKPSAAPGLADMAKIAIAPREAKLAQQKLKFLETKLAHRTLEEKVLANLSTYGDPADLWTVQSRVAALPSALRLFPPCISYCEKWMKDAKCYSTKCKYRHSKLPTGSLANSLAAGYMGNFAIKDCFKEASNLILRELTWDLKEQRCFVLDGESGATVKTLARPRHLVLAPNVDLDVTKALEDACVTASSSSFTACVVAKNARVHFGCVYLDYMWPLNYFDSTQRELRKHLSKRSSVTSSSLERIQACEEFVAAALTDGIHDVELLVLDPKHCLLSPTGAVLAVTIVHSKASPLSGQRAQLERLLLRGAELHQASLDFLGYTTPSKRPVATHFYGWNLNPGVLNRFYLPKLTKKQEKFAFFDAKDRQKLHTPVGRRRRPRGGRNRRGRHRG